jgi:hypothetical protein
MKIIAGWVVALAMIAGTGTAIALNAKLLDLEPLNAKPRQTSAEERCIGLGCWPESPATKRRSAQRTSPVQPGLGGQTGLASQASRLDRSRKADRITIVVPAGEALLPPECEPPFSPLARLPSPKLVARCLT